MTRTCGVAHSLVALALVGPPQAQDGGPLRGEPVLEAGATTLDASYQRRHALVVGIDAYEDAGYVDLDHAVADARAVARILVERFGFAPDDVRLLLDGDATQAALNRALEEWACDPGRVGPNDLFVFFFAGHGMTREVPGRGQSGYLVPVDGRHGDDGPSWGTLVGMRDLEEVSEYVPAKHALFVLDCCFGGLAIHRGGTPLSAGLSARARQVLTAGTASQPVLDQGGGGHSVFTGAVLGGLEGAADVDADEVVTFGELFNHVGREVERRTGARQTPLQATFRDHEGGSVAFFRPGTKPGAVENPASRLRSLQRSFEEQLAELKRLSDYILVQDLLDEAEGMWPPEPSRLPAYRGWLARSRDLLSRLPRHEESVRRVRQEAYLSLVVAGERTEGEGTEPDWKAVDAELRWRHETFARLVERLGDLAAAAVSVERRVDVASTLWQRSIGDHEAAWAQACAAVEGHPLYALDRLALVPQLGLVPLGEDPYSGLLEFAHVLTGEVPERDPGTGRLRIGDESGLVLVLVPGGTFVMGARTDDGGLAMPDEWPAHEVTLEPFFLSKYEMTQGQWLRATGKNPSRYGPSGRWVPYWIEGGGEGSLAHPVERVSWPDCERTLLQLGLVLPTEAQWEYAARAGTDTPWWSGAEIADLEEVANVADVHAFSTGGERWECEEGLDDGYTVHAPVGSFLENPLGLHDVHGNVWEWCRDRYGGYDLPTRPGDGERIVEGVRLRVIRGGSFYYTAARSRSSERDDMTPETAGVDLGVRPARTIDTDPAPRPHPGDR